LLKTWAKHDPCQRITSPRKQEELTNEVKTCTTVDRLSPSSSTYATNLSSKLYDDKRFLTCVPIATLDVSMTLKSPIITWQDTHNEFMKLITRINMSCPNLNIHKSKKVIDVTHESKAGITYCSMVLTTNDRMAC
jgi:hypothetical protein